MKYLLRRLLLWAVTIQGCSPIQRSTIEGHIQLFQTVSPRTLSNDNKHYCLHISLSAFTGARILDRNAQLHLKISLKEKHLSIGSR